MIRNEGGSLYLEGPVTMWTVAGLIEAALPHLQAGAHTADFAGVTEVDSAAVALALEWQRQAARRNVTFRLRNLPEAMKNLAGLYGVADLMQTETA